MPGFNANFGQVNQQVAAVDINNSNPNQQGQPEIKSESVSEIAVQEQHQQSSMPTQSIMTMNTDQSVTNTPNTSVMNVNQTSVNAFDAFAQLSMGDTTEIIPANEENTATTVPTKSTPDCIPSRFAEGSRAVYRDSQNNVSIVNIIKVHLDDDLQPFYTIQMSDGREKQTDDAHLEPSSSDAGNEPEQMKLPTEENVTNADRCDTVVDDELSPEIKNIVAALKHLNSEQMIKVEEFISELTKQANLNSDSINATGGNTFPQLKSPDQPSLDVVRNQDQEVTMQHNSNLPMPVQTSQTMQHTFNQQGQKQMPSYQGNQLDQHQSSMAHMGQNNQQTQQMLGSNQGVLTNGSQPQMQQAQYQAQVSVHQTNSQMLSPQTNGVLPNSQMMQNPGGHASFQQPTQPNMALPPTPPVAPSQQPQPMIEKQGNPFDGW